MTGTSELLTRELARVFQPFAGLFAADRAQSFFAELGFKLPDGLFNDSAVIQALGTVAAAAQELPGLVAALDTAVADGVPADVAVEAAALIAKVKAVINALDALDAAFTAAWGQLVNTAGSLTPALVQTLCRRAADHAVYRYFENWRPALGRVLKLLGILELAYVPDDPGNVLLVAAEIRVVHYDNVSNLFDPVAAIEQHYGWGQTSFDAASLLEDLNRLATAVGLPTGLDSDPVTGETIGLDCFFLKVSEKTDITPPGLKAVFDGALAADFYIRRPVIQDGTAVEIYSETLLAANTQAFLSPTAGWSVVPPSGTAQGSVIVNLYSGTSDGSAFPVLALGGGNGIMATGLRVTAGARLNWDSAHNRAVADAFIEGALDRGLFTLNAEGRDSFLSSVLPGSGISSEFDLVVGVSASSGLYIEGSGTLEVRIPTNVAFAGIHLDAVTISAAPGTDSFPVAIGGSFALKLGPLKAVVENVGVTLDFAFGPGGNMGPVDLTVGLKPPTGVGLAIDGGGFKGGGYLSFEPDKHRYTGVLELEFKDSLSLKAIGILENELPGGVPGYSLLIIISADFTPIQLGYGFTLNGVGGLLGLNRTTNIDVLCDGVKTGAFAGALFPVNVLENAAQIISDLQQIFPPTPDRFLFGPMAKIGWGTPKLVDIQLGLIVDGPEPWRLMIPGVLRVVLPSESDAIVRLQINFLGTWAEATRTISFFATLYESSILSIPLGGDMALLLNYGDNPGFVMSAGGFNLAFEPPAGPLRSMNRLNALIRDDGDVRISAEAYLALTSNTAQFGCRIDAFASKGNYTAQGFMTFDALFQFSPFYFAVALSASAAIKRKGKNILSADLSLALSGPAPWSASGSATFTFAKLDCEVSFSRSWGRPSNPGLPDIAVFGLVTDAIEARGNWDVELPQSSQMIVTLRALDDLAPGEMVIAPHGVLVIAQKVVPLETVISRFGNQNPLGATRFTISRVHIDGTDLARQTIREEFAPAQFEAMTNAQKLSRKSFEKLPSGVRATLDDASCCTGTPRIRDVAYETKIIDPRGFPFIGGPAITHNPNYQFELGWGFASSWSGSAYNNLASVLGPPRISVANEGFAVVNMVNLGLIGAETRFASETEAHAHLGALIAADPWVAGEILVVPDYVAKAA